MEETVLSRVTSEKQALDANLSKLVEFLAKEGTAKLVGDVQFKLLKRQKNAMENYSDVLSSRIGDLHAAETAILSEEFDVPESDLVETSKPVKKLTGQEAIDYIKDDLGIDSSITDKLTATTAEDYIGEDSVPELKLAENPKVGFTKVDWEELEDIDPEELK